MAKSGPHSKAQNPQEPSPENGPPEPNLQGALEALDILIQKPKVIPPAKVVAAALTRITKALEQGYNFKDIAQVFAEHGVKISSKNLKEEYEKAVEKVPSLQESSSQENSVESEKA
jgi:hypothetical protein